MCIECRQSPCDSRCPNVSDETFICPKCGEEWDDHQDLRYSEVEKEIIGCESCVRNVNDYTWRRLNNG